MCRRSLSLLFLCIFLFPAFLLADTSSEGSVGDGLKCPPGFAKHNGYFCKGKLQNSKFCTICNTCGDDYVITADGEECDDGKNNHPNARCNINCTRTYCGDGSVQNPNGFDLAEQCDNGPGNAANGSCNENCKLTECGDGIVQSPNGAGDDEQCDLGESNSTNSACSPECKKTVCGDGVLQRPNGDNETEECDGENYAAGYPDQKACKNDCTVAYCGNEIREETGDYQEECDYTDIAQYILDKDSTAVCLEDCTAEYCGNGKVERDEQCDDGNDDNTDSCTNVCKDPVCGDGYQQAGEQCDDGNDVNDDGCNLECELPVCGNGIVDQGEACDDGNDDNTDSCTSACEPPVCGDGYLQDPEECDDGENNGNKASVVKEEADQKYYCTKECQYEESASDCVWIAQHAHWSVRDNARTERHIDSIWRRERITRGQVDSYEEVPSCFAQYWSKRCTVRYANFRNESGIQIFGKCGNNHHLIDFFTNPNKGPMELYRPKKSEKYNFHVSKFTDFYMDENCNAVNREDRKVCGFVGVAATPISLILDDQDAVLHEGQIVEFSLHPAYPKAKSLWKASDKAPLLVYDPEHTGQVKSAEQLFGNWTFGGMDSSPFIPVSSMSLDKAKPWSDGYEALGQLDINGDFVISGTELEGLYLWFDSNRDAVVDSGELRSVLSENISKLYYHGAVQSDNNQDIELQVGFEKIVDGKIITGKSVDWYGELFFSNKAAQDGFSDSLESTMMSPDMQIVHSRNPLEFKHHSVKESDYVKDVSGFWIWTIEKDKKANRPGLLALEQSDDGTVVGYSVVEAELATNGEELKSVVKIFPLTGLVEESPVGLKLTFQVIDEESGGITNNVVVFDDDGKVMHGESKQQFLNENFIDKESSVIEYKWLAGRVG